MVIPQIPLFEILKKYNGHTWHDQVTHDARVRKQYRIKHLPRYLILHLARFTKNNFYLEKNPTIVTFPVKNLEMKDFLFPTDNAQQKLEKEGLLKLCPAYDELPGLDPARLKDVIEKYGAELHKMELSHLNQTLVDGKIADKHYSKRLLLIAERTLERIELFSSTKYDLVANICHESTNSANGVAVGDINLGININDRSKNRKPPASTVLSGAAPGTGVISNVLNQGTYKVHTQHKATGQWYELEDLRVVETTPQLIGSIMISYLLNFS